MRIALVVPGGVDRSGDYRVIPALLALISRLSRHNDVQVFALQQESQAGEWQLAGARIYNIGKDWTALRTVRKICSVHRSKPFDIVQAIWSGWVGTIAVATGKILGIPSAVHVAGGEAVSIPEIGYGGRLKWRGRCREVLTLRTASAVTVASAPTIETLLKDGVTAQRVPLGVDLAEWPVRDPVRRKHDRQARLIHVASLNRVKDQPTLLRALVELRRLGFDFTMDVVGEDTLNGAIQLMASQCGLSERIRFHGFLPQRQLRGFIEAADLLIVSSRHETGPVAVLEAAVAGVPTVGTHVGHIAEWAPHAAASAPVADWFRLATEIAKMLDDEDLRLQVASQAQRRAVGEDADYTVECFQGIYNHLA